MTPCITQYILLFSFTFRFFASAFSFTREITLSTSFWIFFFTSSLRKGCKSGTSVTDKNVSLIDSSWFCFRLLINYQPLSLHDIQKNPTSTTPPFIFGRSVGAQPHCGIRLITQSPTDKSLNFCFVFLVRTKIWFVGQTMQVFVPK